MKISKVLKVQNLGKFLDYKTAGDMIFSDFSIIYGENGKGKTTFSTILRSLKTGDTSLLLEKKSTNATGPISIEILLENNKKATYEETKNSWSISNQDLEIFDSVHVNNNVYSGDHVDHLHKKNLYYLVIGEYGVNLANEINSLDARIKQENDEFKALEAELKGQIYSKITIDNFVNLELDADLDTKINSIDKTLEELQESESIASTKTLESIDLPDFSFTELKSLLGTTIESVSDEATSHVKDYCNTLGDRAESWIKTGLEYIPESILPVCPFCQQDISDNQLINHYRAYFSQAYKQLKERIENFFPVFAQTFSEKKVLEIQSQFSDNILLVNFWSRFINISLDNPSIKQLFETRTALMSNVNRLISQKKEKPLDPIEIDSETLSLITIYKELGAQFNVYNANITRINKSIDQKKVDTKRVDLNQIKQEKNRLIEIQHRFTPSVEAICSNYIIKKNQLDTLKKEKQQKSKELKEYSEDILEKYKTTINEYLLKFGADFSIVEPKTSLYGGTPSANYSLSIDGKSVPLGTNETLGEPCFRSVLSDGDKSSLAFALFMAQLRSDPDLSKKTIIIDDPITSLDIHRKKSTCQEIKKIAAIAKQCIVLSHDPFFLKSFWENYPNVKTFQIKRYGKQSVFCEWDIHQETLPDYLRDFFRLQKFIEEGDSDLIGIARCIRPVLEGNLRVRFPKEFKLGEWLGGFIKSIDEAPKGSGLERMKIHLNELKAINDYSKSYHHQQNPLADIEPINDVELTAFVKRTLAIVEVM